MKRNFSEKEKQKIINRHLSGESITLLSKEFNVSRTTLYAWKNNRIKNKKTVNLLIYKRMEERLLKAKNIIKILQTTSSLVNSPSMKKYETVTELSNEYNISTICEALNLAKGSYYNHILRAKKVIVWQIKDVKNLNLLLKKFTMKINKFLVQKK